MTEKQQTAVQWLYKQLNSSSTNNTFIKPELINQALAMEREQRIEDMRTAFYKGVDAWMQNPDAQESIFNDLIQQKKTS